MDITRKISHTRATLDKSDLHADRIRLIVQDGVHSIVSRIGDACIYLNSLLRIMVSCGQKD